MDAARPHFELRGHDGNIVCDKSWLKANDEASGQLWAQSISSTANGALPAYRLPCHELGAALPSEDFIRAVCHDARELVIGSAIHVCGHSCWKYHSQGASHICRHNFYHVVSFYDWPGGTQSCKRRGRGKHLRGCIAIMVDTRYGMAGRILTFQEHPFECGTNYAALVAARCNCDVQDMRRVFPPHLWLEDSELETWAADAAATDPSLDSSMVVQRLRGYSIGSRPAWGWMQAPGTTEHAQHTLLLGDDWPQYFAEIVGASPSGEEADETTMAVARAAKASAAAIFVDAHNAGFYINSYTTKLNPTMDMVLRRLLDGVRRLNQSWQDRDAAANAAGTEPTANGKTSRRDFGRTAQLLGKFQNAFVAASWKSGCEMLFPILFGHMSFQTHRCWCVFVKKACGYQQRPGDSNVSNISRSSGKKTHGHCCSNCKVARNA